MHVSWGVVTWSVHPAGMHDGEVDVSVSLCQLLCHHHLLPLEHTSMNMSECSSHTVVSVSEWFDCECLSLTL